MTPTAHELVRMEYTLQRTLTDTVQTRSTQDIPPPTAFRIMRFHPFRPSARQARTECPFCAGLAAQNGPLCNICRIAGLGGRS